MWIIQVLYIGETRLPNLTSRFNDQQRGFNTPQRPDTLAPNGRSFFAFVVLRAWIERSTEGGDNSTRQLG